MKNKLNPPVPPFFKGGIGIKDIVTVFSKRADGNMSLCYGNTSLALDNRKNFLTSLGIDYRNLVCAKQTHSANVRYVTEADSSKGALSYDDSIADTDAFVTDKRNLPLAIFTADCLPVFLYDLKTPAIGMVHAGWRSTKANISAQAVQLMQKLFHSDALSLQVSFGPAIRNCCYQVNADSDDFSWGNLIERSGEYYLDLPAINKKQLMGTGVKKENIFDSEICTLCRNKDFFSFRKEEKMAGRMISVIMLKK